MITDHKPLVIIFKKDATTLSHRPQRILLCIHQYNVRILYNPGSQLFIADWISKDSHSENKDEKILGMRLNINGIDMCTDIPKSMMAEEIRCAPIEDDHINTFFTFVPHQMLLTRAEVIKEIQPN